MGILTNLCFALAFKVSINSSAYRKGPLGMPKMPASEEACEHELSVSACVLCDNQQIKQLDQQNTCCIKMIPLHTQHSLSENCMARCVPLTS